MEQNNGRSFSVQAVVEGKSQELLVETSETTDGVSFYNCRIHGNEITQIRKDENVWKQICGDISDADVKSIGEAIEGSVLENQ